MNVLDTITLFGTVALAAPIGLLGIEFLLGGRLVVGSGFVFIALAVVVGGYFRPSIKSIVAGTVAEATAEDATTDGESDEEAYKG